MEKELAPGLGEGEIAELVEDQEVETAEQIGRAALAIGSRLGIELGVEWKFLKAVGIDERITGRVEIVSVRDGKPICRLETSIRNEAGELCLTGTATTYTVPLRALAKAEPDRST